MSNLALAKQAYDYSLEKIKASSNDFDEKELDSKEAEEVANRVGAMRAIEIRAPEFSLGWIKEIAEQAEKNGVGNCCEKACVAFMHLLRKAPPGTHIELFNNPFQDHFFVVVGRSPETDSSNPFSWNRDACICDAWGKSCFEIGSVKTDKKSLRTEQHPVVRGLLSNDKIRKEPVVSLSSPVLAKSNQIKDPGRVIVDQAKIVLRQAVTQDKTTLDFSADNGLNTKVPMCYEAWDYPQEKHFKKQKRINKLLKNPAGKLSLFAKNAGAAAKSASDSPPLLSENKDPNLEEKAPSPNRLK
jgi:hypothetical protein